MVGAIAPSSGLEAFFSVTQSRSWKTKVTLPCWVSTYLQSRHLQLLWSLILNTWWGSCVLQGGHTVTVGDAVSTKSVLLHEVSLKTGLNFSFLNMCYEIQAGPWKMLISAPVIENQASNSNQEVGSLWQVGLWDLPGRARHY